MFPSWSSQWLTLLQCLWFLVWNADWSLEAVSLSILAELRFSVKQRIMPPPRKGMKRNPPGTKWPQTLILQSSLFSSPTETQLVLPFPGFIGILFPHSHLCVPNLDHKAQCQHANNGHAPQGPMWCIGASWSLIHNLYVSHMLLKIFASVMWLLHNC